MAKWQTHPQQQITITHSGTDYVVNAVNISVRRRENGFDTASILLTDTYADTYANKSSNDDTITIKQKDASESAWTTLLTGIIRERHPAISSESNSLRLECDGAGYPLGVTVVGAEYGEESSNIGINTIKEATEDIIDNWVENVLGTATASGHTITTDIEDIAGTLRYIHFPYKWSHKAINDLCDYLQAIKGATAGPHWIVATDSNFLLTTVGAHAAPAATHWPTWWRTDAAGSTLTEGIDFELFNFQELSKEANYILYGGKWRRPGNGDACEQTAASWAAQDASGGITPAPTVNDENGGHTLVGSWCIYTFIGGGAGGIGRIYWPLGGNMHLDLSHLGKIGDPPRWNFYAMKHDAVNALYAQITTDSTHYYWHEITPDLATASKWYHFSLPLGPYYNTAKETEDFVWETVGPAGPVNWADLNWIGFYFGISDNKYLYLDGLHMCGGPLLRGARQVAVYTSTDPMKIKVITDDVAKDDSLKASDDTGVMARLAHAELLRSMSTPIIGTFTTPIANDILPGQLIHIHAKKKVSGTYAIDKNFRVTQPVHIIGTKALTNWTVTDDLTNALARSGTNDLNAVLQHVRPEWQDRQASSIKGAILDIDVPILEKSY